MACPNLTRTLGRGASGSEVAGLQAFLAGLPGIYPEALTTGFFGPLTEKALQRFQAERGIAYSGSPAFNGFGLLGPRTRAMINVVCAESSNGSAVLTPAPVSSPTPPPSPIISASAGPQMDLKINSSDGPVKVFAGSDITISWTLSNHAWWYCGKLRDWSGSIIPPVSGSEVIPKIAYSKIFKLNCYVDNVATEDQVSVEVVPAPTPTPTPTPITVSSPLRAEVPYDGPFGRIDCATSVWPGSVYYLEDGPPTVRWQVSSTPTYDWDFYWHETVDGVETKTYGGTTFGDVANNVSKLESYEFKTMKIKRYADVVIDQNHAPYALYSASADSICRTNEVEFEIKTSRTP